MLCSYDILAENDHFAVPSAKTSFGLGDGLTADQRLTLCTIGCGAQFRLERPMNVDAARHHRPASIFLREFRQLSVTDPNRNERVRRSLVVEAMDDDLVLVK